MGSNSLSLLVFILLSQLAQYLIRMLTIFSSPLLSPSGIGLHINLLPQSQP